MKFRFEPILKLNKTRENIRQKELGRINSHFKAQQERMNFMANIVENGKQEYNDKLEQDMDLNTRFLYGNFFNGIKLEEKRQEQIVSEIETKRETKRKEVIEAMRKRRTMEILKERDFMAFKKKQVKMEIEQMDEMAANQWRRYKQEFLK